ncbi:MAG: lytic transglycosylase domain-containing protein [Actinomycetota bacterium]
MFGTFLAPDGRPPSRLARVVPVLIATSLLGGVAGALESGPATEPDEVVVSLPIDPADGRQIEAVLATVGLDAAWRSATGLHDITRAMTVEYVDDGQLAVEELIQAVSVLQTNLDQHDRVATQVRDAAIDVAAAHEDEREATIERNRADAHLEGVVALTASIAVDLFAGNGDRDDELLGVDGQQIVQVQRTMELRGHTLDEMLERRARAIERLDDAEQALLDATAARVQLVEEHAALVDDAAALLRERIEIEDGLQARIEPAAEAFVLADAGSIANLTPRAVDAYIRAEFVMRRVAPECQISWRTIGAISGVEGAHGTFGGRTLSMDGTPNDDIVGLRLDGAEVDNFGDTVANIRDTDGGRWDGDEEYDRAVGPMQFIPSTWSRWGADGDGDGVAHPQDLDDAAVAAGGYLCAYGDHSQWDNWIRAVFAYNHSNAYVNSVQSRLVSMQQLTLPTIEGIDLVPSQPAGVFVPLPIPVPCPTEGDGSEVPVEGVALAGQAEGEQPDEGETPACTPASGGDGATPSPDAGSEAAATESAGEEPSNNRSGSPAPLGDADDGQATSASADSGEGVGEG